MAKTENRFIRIEDYKGNVYYPEVGGRSTAGDIKKEASSEPGDDPYTDGTMVNDVKATEGKAIIRSSYTVRKYLYKCTFDVPFGMIDVGFRAKSTLASGTAELLEVNINDKNKVTGEIINLYTQKFIGSDFVDVITYLTFFCPVNFAGVFPESVLELELVVLPNSGEDLWVDYVFAALTTTKGGGSDIHVEGSVVVVGD